MPTINVTVYDSTENKRVPVELPDDAPCNKIIAVLGAETATAHKWPGWRATQLQVPSQKLRTSGAGYADAGRGTGW